MIERNRYVHKIIPFMDKELIKVITGIRRSGKSSLIAQLIEVLKSKGVDKQQIIHINMELMEFDNLKNYKDFYAYIKQIQNNHSGKIYLFVDEVQEIEGWEKAINSFLAEGKYDIYITGSNAKLLSGELASLLSGRYLEFKMFTLVYNEFLEFRNQKASNSEFNLFIKYGGFPGIHHMILDDIISKQYLQAIHNSVILKDVIIRNKIRDVALLDVLSKYLIDNCGNITSAKGISDYMKSQKRNVTVDTVLNYIRYMCDAMLFEKVQRYDIKGKRLLETYEKYYMMDIGLSYANLGYTPEKIPGLLENIVLLELKSRDYEVCIGKINELEIDFIATKGNDKLYIQVCTTLNTENVIEREYKSLSLVNDSFPKFVLSLDEGFNTNQNGIKWMNVQNFLLWDGY